MNQTILWFALSVVFAVVYAFFRARWWLYLALVFLDSTLLAALGLDDMTQLLALGILLVGFLILDLLVFKRRKPVSSD
jgi:ABC-type thiamin/hydroxymethylpyrimidine transport system permease subunit